MCAWRRSARSIIILVIVNMSDDVALTQLRRAALGALALGAALLAAALAIALGANVPDGVELLDLPECKFVCVS